MLEIIAAQISQSPNLIPCHNNEDLQQKEFQSVCCDFVLELGRCQQTNNYIVLNYSKDYLKYIENNRFEFGYYNGFANNNTQRKSISFINYKDLTYRIDSNFTLDVAKKKEEGEEEDQIIELHFLEPIKNLSSFFSTKNVNMEEGEGDFIMIKSFPYEPIYSIDFSHFDSSLIEDISSMFENNRLIKEINFNNFNTSHIKNMDKMFKDCYALSYLDLSNFDTSSVTSMASMFENCYYLKSLDLSNFNTSSVTSMNSMFKNCIYLAYLDISNFIMNNGINYTDMFQHLSSLKYISLINIRVDENRNEVFSSLIRSDIPMEKVLLVCQNDTYISNASEFCCEKNNNSLYCKTDNYITIKYKENTEYICGFGIENECTNDYGAIPGIIFKGMNDNLLDNFEPNLKFFR